MSDSVNNFIQLKLILVILIEFPQNCYGTGILK